jgi:hypothetical protein
MTALKTEGADFLLTAVFQQLEIIDAQVFHRLPFAIQRYYIHDYQTGRCPYHR